MLGYRQIHTSQVTDKHVSPQATDKCTPQVTGKQLPLRLQTRAPLRYTSDYKQAHTGGQGANPDINQTANKNTGRVKAQTLARISYGLTCAPQAKDKYTPSGYRQACASSGYKQTIVPSGYGQVHTFAGCDNSHLTGYRQTCVPSSHG